ncbi:dTMP kinase [Candidatus Woesearchaeota archaeon]|nr:dTMP kinase [Candidatus Woesearchaeota archaeon]
MKQIFWRIKITNIICLDGCPGTGKSTQCNLLREYFREYRVNGLVIVEKNYEPFKSLVRSWWSNRSDEWLFTEKQIQDFAVARGETFRRHFSNRPDLDLLVIDRYIYTSGVYQRNKEGITPEDIIELNLQRGAPLPDLSLLLDCNADISYERIRKRDILTRKNEVFAISLERMKHIRNRYLSLLRSRKELIRVETNRSPEEIHQDIITLIC